MKCFCKICETFFESNSGFEYSVCNECYAKNFYEPKKRKPMKKTISIPKCPKTVTGKHKFVKGKTFTPHPPPIAPSDCYLKCKYCGLIDDREERK